MNFSSSTAAPQRKPTTQRMDVARELVLAPFGLDESHLARALADISDGGLISMLFMTAPGNSNCHEY